MIKNSTIKQIAQLANISIATVSIVLSGKGNEKKISKNTQEKIVEIAKRLNYKPNQLARGLNKGKSNTIGILVGDISNPFFSKIASEIEILVREAGFSMLLFSTNEDPQQEINCLNWLAEHRVDGVLSFSTGKVQNEYSAILKDKKPIVLIDRDYQKLKITNVGVNNSEGAYLLTNHLISLGHKKIGIIINKSEINEMQYRLQGYRQALKDFGIPFLNKRVVQSKGLSVDMKVAIQTLLSPKANCSAIVFGNNQLAINGMKILNSMNIKIPQQIAIVSFDDHEAFEITNPPITAFDQPLKEIGKTSFELLIKQFNSENSEILKLKLPGNLIIRKSCGS